MKKKIVLMICMLLFSMIATSLAQSQMIIGNGRTFIITETINLSGGSYGGYTDWSQFQGVYEIGLEIRIHGDVTGVFITNFSVDGMNDAIERCRVNNHSRFVLPDGAMLIDEYSDIVFDIDLDNFSMIGEEYNYKEFVSIPILKPFQKILNRTHFNFSIPKRSECDSVFLVKNPVSNSTIFRITGNNFMIKGIQIKFLQSSNSIGLCVFGNKGIYCSGDYGVISDIYICNNWRAGVIFPVLIV